MPPTFWKHLTHVFAQRGRIFVPRLQALKKLLLECDAELAVGRLPGGPTFPQHSAPHFAMCDRFASVATGHLNHLGTPVKPSARITTGARCPQETAD
jgi:hypothetical protein